MGKRPGEEDDHDDLDDMDMINHDDPDDDQDDEEDQDEDEGLDDQDEDDGQDEDDQDEDDQGAADPDDQDEDDEFSASSVPKVKKKTAAGRISELTRQLREAQRAAFEADLRAQAAQPQTTSEDQPLVPPKADRFEFGEYDPKYLEAQAEYLADKKFRERMAASKTETAAATEEQRRQHYKRRADEVMVKGTAKYEDFPEATSTFTADVARLVLDSDMAVDIAYYLGNNLKLLRRLTAMSSTDQAREIGRLEGRFSVSSTVRKSSRAPATPSRKGHVTQRQKAVESKYGPDDQDEFDKAFLGL